MKENHTILDSIMGAFVPIHRDGFKFVAGAALVALILLAVAPPLGWVAVVATLACAYFFRDPDRVTPARKGLVVSAADGKIAAIAEVPPAPELRLGEETLKRISVFLSIFDVRIVRAPVAERIAASHYVPGAFFNAELDKASEENERRALVIERREDSRLSFETRELFFIERDERRKELPKRLDAVEQPGMAVGSDRHAIRRHRQLVTFVACVRRAAVPKMAGKMPPSVMPFSGTPEMNVQLSLSHP